MSKLTTGELHIMFNNLDEKLSAHMETSKENNNRLIEMLKEVKDIATQTRDQALKTNGRVNAHDQKFSEIMPIISSYHDDKAAINGAIKLWGIIGTTVISLLGYFAYLYVQEQEQIIAKQVVSEIEQKYDVQVK